MDHLKYVYLVVWDGEEASDIKVFASERDALEFLWKDFYTSTYYDRDDYDELYSKLYDEWEVEGCGYIIRKDLIV